MNTIKNMELLGLKLKYEDDVSIDKILMFSRYLNTINWSDEKYKNLPNIIQIIIHILYPRPLFSARIYSPNSKKLDYSTGRRNSAESPCLTA